MGILDIFGKRDVSSELTKRIPYALKLSFHPYRLSANRSDSSTLRVEIKNLTKEPLLTSIVVRVPKKLGLDQTCLSQIREIRLGELAPGELKNLNIEIYGGTKTDQGSYPIEVTAISHYRNYSYVINYERARATLRAV